MALLAPITVFGAVLPLLHLLMSLSAPQAAALLASSFVNAQLVVCVEVAAATLFFYDYFTTLSSEVELLTIVLYYALFKGAPNNCRFTALVLIGITIGDAILVLRTWAIWDTSRAVLVLLATLLCASTVTNAYYLTRYLRGLILFPLERLDPSIVRLFGRHSCLDREIGVLWIVVAAFKLGISAANVVFVYTQPLEYVILLALMQGTFHSILTCRLTLHIRSVATEDTTLALSSLSISTVVDSRTPL
ncbi:hypothetical protein AURDEDRAFT_172855 [Auricularia subglabra TFB-10046 SS5]|uniref:Uncharacterized protein n=1 Tax=Auricularia subglabra (strain TFB-10046 / SS5) TaxID=717982 RepID=J0WVF8_AURST|nr:hypothetical protein AURDEDRAFT_172855 [Auricularia subglabra TFB-10046 SS5]